MIIKKIIAIGCLLTVNLLGLAQDQVPLTVFFYNLDIDPDFQAELREPDEIIEDLSEFLQGKNPLKEGVIDHTYDKLAAHIENRTKFKFLPIETLRKTDGRVIFYTARGYPMGSKKRAVTHNTSPYYGFIQINVIARSGSTSSSSLGLLHSEKKKFEPGVRITLKIFDKRGKRVGNYDVVARSEEEVIIQTKMVNWLKVGDDRRLEDRDNQQTLADLIDKAISMLMNEMMAGPKV